MSNRTSQNFIKGGSFLIEDIGPDRIWTFEDITDEQEMIAKTTEDFVINEVLPEIESLGKTGIFPDSCAFKRSRRFRFVSSGYS